MAGTIDWSPWPDAGDGLPPGPRTEVQRLMQWFKYPDETHHHGVDYVLVRGGRRAGKSLGAVCWCLENALYTPGFQAIVGAKDTPQLDRTSKKIFRERLTLSGSDEEWNSPLVIHK